MTPKPQAKTVDGIKYFSMFSGIGGFELGIQNAYRSEDGGSQENTQGNRNEPKESQEVSTTQRPTSTGTTDRADQRPLCIGYSEVDKYAIKVYERQFNGHKNYGDATTINAKELPDFDLLVGGFPCQAFSVAGKRAGFNDTRGTLFFDIARILAEKRPRHLVLENVKGLLSHDQGKTFQTILGVLSDLGYRVEWQVLNSKDFGVPQNRERIFIVGHLRGECSRQVLPIGEDDKVSTEPDTRAEPEAQHTFSTIATNTKRKESSYIQQINQPVHSNDRLYSEDGLSPTLNTMQGGNRQPFVKLKDSAIMGLHHDRKESKLDDGTLESQTKLREEEAGLFDMQGKEGANGDTPHRRGLAQQQDREPTGTLPKLPHETSQEKTELQARELQPNTPQERLLRETQPEVQEVRQSSNGQEQSAQPTPRIRRLTPLETERLQAYPDNWTKYGEDEHGMRVDISDTQRYKMAGNAVTVNVVEAVMRELFNNCKLKKNK